MNNEGSLAQQGVESLVALLSHIDWCLQLSGDQDLRGPGARGKIKIIKPLRRPARVWIPILKQTSIGQCHGIYLCKAISDTLTSKYSVENKFK